MNTKKNLTVATLVALLSVPAFNIGHTTHLNIPKFSDSLMIQAHADSQFQSGVPSAIQRGSWHTPIQRDKYNTYSQYPYTRTQLHVDNDDVSYASDWYNNQKQFKVAGNGWGAGINPSYKDYGNGKYVIDTSKSNGFVSTMQMLDPYDMDVWNNDGDGNQYLGTFHKDGAPIYHHHTTPTPSTKKKRSSKQKGSNYVSLPSSYLGKWYAGYDYGPKSAGNGKSIYSPYLVDLGRNQGYYYASNVDRGPIVYTYGTEGGFTGYHYWLKNKQAAGGGNNFRLLPNGELEWHEDTSTWHLHHVYHHNTPKPNPTPNPEPTPTPTPNPTPSSDSNSNSSSTPSTNNGNDDGDITPTGSTTDTNGTYSNYQSNQNTDSPSTMPTFDNTNLGSINNADNVSDTTNTDTNADNKLPQTNESNHTTAEAILGATALATGASLMALDFSKKHKYEVMENTDAKHLSNGNSRNYNEIMSNTFANISKKLKNM